MESRDGGIVNSLISAAVKLAGSSLLIVVLVVFAVSEIGALEAQTITLTWDANKEPDIAGYRAYYRYLDWKVIDSGQQTSVTLSNLVAGATYNFYVTAVNLAGVESRPSVIIDATLPGLSLPPIIIEQPRAQNVLTETPVQIAVRAAGTAPFMYQWFKDGEILPDKTNQVLSIDSAGESDTGVYYVEVRNESGLQRSSDAQLVMVNFPEITNESEPLFVEPGDSFTLSVGAAGEALDYRWYHNGELLFGNTNSILIITNASAASAGEYVAKVSNVAGIARGDPIFVTVLGPPLIILQSDSATINEGETITFEVMATGTPDLNYQWFRDGELLPRETNPEITIFGSEDSPRTKYSVLVWNAQGQVTSSDISLDVLTRPLIISGPFSDSAQVGGSLLFSVEVEGTEPMIYTWFKDGERLPSETNAFLLVENVQVEDAGTYWVTLENSVGHLQSNPAELTVQGAPVILRQPVSQKAAPGWFVELAAPSTGTQPLYYQWFYNDQPLSGENGGSLIIFNFKQGDVGNYRVQVSNDEGSVFSEQCELSLFQPPEFLAQLTNQAVEAGSTAAFNAEISGTGPFQYSWYKNGLLLKGETNSTLLITNAQIAAVGEYTVRVSNYLQTIASQAATLALLGAPLILEQPSNVIGYAGEPFGLTVRATGTSPIFYQWFKDSQSIAGETNAALHVLDTGLDHNGQYFVVASDSSGMVTSMVASATILLPPTITTEPVSQSVFLGESAQLVVGAIATETLGYLWVKDGVPLENERSNTLSVPAVQVSDVGTYVCWIFDSSRFALTRPVSLSLLGPPLIIREPDDTNGIPGKSITLSVGITGSPILNLQWLKEGESLTGETNEDFFIPSMRAQYIGNYSVVITNLFGAITSHVSRVRLASPPIITSQITNEAVILGGSIQVTAQAASFEEMHYSWFKDGEILDGETNASLSIISVEPAHSGVYTVGIYNQFGADFLDLLHLTVLSPPEIVMGPTNAVAFSEEDIQMNVSAIGTAPLNYQWFKNGQLLRDETNDFIAFPSVQATNAGDYEVLVTNAFGFARSQVASLNIILPPVITLQPANQAVNAGVPLDLAIHVSGSEPLHYQWVKNGVDLGGATGPIYHIVSAQENDVGAYRVRVFNAAGAVTSDEATVTVIIPPGITSGPVGQTVNLGFMLTLQVQASGTAPLQYQWSRNGIDLSGATSPNYQVASAQASDSGLYRVRVSNSAGMVTSAAAAVNVVIPPAIVAQPADQTVNAGFPVNLQVQASGTAPLTYQWSKNGVDLNAGTNSIHNVPEAQASDAGLYQVRIFNPAGAVTSVVATVIVIIPPSITSEPISQTVDLGSPVTLQVQASGTAPLQYQWSKNGIDLSGATGSSYSIPATQASDAGSYRVRVSNGAGTVTSIVVMLTVTIPPAITKEPADQAVNEGSPVSLEVEATGSGPLQYQWQQNGEDLNAGTNSTYSIGSAHTSDAGSYRVRVFNSAGAATSIVTTVTVIVPPSITSEPASQTVNAGSPTGLQVQASGSAPLQYQWSKNGIDIGGAVGPSYNIVSAQSSDSGAYRVRVSNAGGTVTSTVATVTVITPPSITTDPVNQTVNAGSPIALAVEATGTAPLQYQWQKNGADLIGATNSIHNIVSAQASDAAFYQVKISNLAGATTSAVATVTVIVPPTITTEPVGQTVNQGSPLSLQVQASGSGPLHYQWSRNGVDLNGEIGPSCSKGSAQASDAGSYQVRVFNPAGSATSVVATVTVIIPPSITVEPISQTVNLGSLLSLQVQASGSTPLQYYWEKDGVDLAGATNASYNILSAQASDAGGYRVRASNSAGAATSVVAAVTVIIPPAITSQPVSQTINLGSSVALQVQTSGTAPLQYQWAKNGTELAGATAPSYTVVSAQASDSGSYEVKVSNPAGAVTSIAATVTVILPPNISTQPNSETVNLGSPVTLQVHANGSDPLSYQWLKNGSNLDGATEASYTILSAQAGDAASYQVRVSNPAGKVTSLVATVTVIIPPGITAEPISQTVNLGSFLSLQVQASGSAPLQYHWQKEGVDLAGATNATYNILAAQASDAGGYRVRLSNSAGVATSVVATVTVIIPPTITGQPVSQTVNLGSAVLLQAQASGSEPLQYQWSKNGTNLIGATAASYVVLAAQTSDMGSYQVRVSNPAGTAMSMVATVTVIVPPGITGQPSSQTVNLGSPVTLQVQASGSEPLSYQWSQNGLTLIGASAASYTVPSAQASDTGSYQVRVSNPAGTATSIVATVTVIVPPGVTGQPSSQTVNLGSPVTLQVRAYGSKPLQYQWAKNGLDLPGASGATYSILSASEADAGSYQARVFNAAGSAMSAIATITVIVPPTIIAQPLSQEINAGSELNLQVAAEGSDPLMYQWYHNGVEVTGATNETYSIVSVKSSDAGDCWVLISNSAGFAVSSTAVISVLVTPATLSVLRNADGIQIMVTGEPGEIYEIQRSSNLSDPEWSSIDLFAADENGLITLTLEYPSGEMEIYRAFLDSEANASRRLSGRFGE